MLTSLSLQALYPYAIADGGGVGLAYEYYAKRLLLSSWLNGLRNRPKRSHALRVLIAGLPEKVGSGLDLLLIAQELGVMPLIVDDRPAALNKLNQTVATAKQLGVLQDSRFKGLIVNDMGVIWEAATDFDVVFSSGVLQRLDPDTQTAYLKHLQQIATDIAIFCPNQANPNHLAQHQVDGIALSTLKNAFRTGQHQSGYAAAAPFATAVSLSQLFDERQVSDRLRTLFFAGLQVSAWLERLSPNARRAARSRLVYTLWRTG